jgi:RNA polymerase primary sigma factor
MRAVEGFDIHRGHRFSTYATLALMKGFARSVPQLMQGRKAAGGDVTLLAELPDPRVVNDSERFAHREEVGRLLSNLNDRERHVMLAHYGLDGQDDAPASYEQVGKRLGLTKEQVRQIERSAMNKLRSAAGVVGN